MRSVKHFTIEEGQSSGLLCAKINQYAEESGLLIFSISFNHYRSAFVIFEQDDLMCEKSDSKPIATSWSKEFTSEPQAERDIYKQKVVIQAEDIKEQYLGRDNAVQAACYYDEAVWTGTGQSINEAIAKLLESMNSETHEFYVNCGYSGTKSAAFFYEEHLKNTSKQNQ